MQIIVKCSSCNKVLNNEAHFDPMDDMIINVKPCNNIDCFDCGKCETEQENKKLREKIAAIKDALGT